LKSFGYIREFNKWTVSVNFDINHAFSHRPNIPIDDFKIEATRNSCHMDFRYLISCAKYITEMQAGKGKCNIGFRMKVQNHFDQFNIIFFNDIHDNQWFTSVKQIEEYHKAVKRIKRGG
jgi:hypothetical protein